MNKEPIVDIVMLVHDQAAWADLAIRAVERFTSNPFRLIVVDSGSKEPATAAMLAEVENRGHTVIHLAENRSFSHGVNVGVAAGSSRFIVILNDDAIVTEGWDACMLQDVSPKHVGIVGPCPAVPAGFSSDPAAQPKDPPFVIFMCVAIRREVWNLLGPMDEITFDGFSSEDLDYSWRVVKAGFTIKLSRAHIMHAGSRTLAATVGDQERRALNDRKYNARLLDKWGKEWVTEHTKVLPRVLIMSYHAEDWTRVSFKDAEMALKRSDGVTFSYHSVKRAPIHFARNMAADYALDHGFDWLIQLDDDALFPSDLVRRLLSHRKDVVCALAYQRNPPHATCVFELDPNGGLAGRPLDGIEHTGLRPVDASGFHCSIINTRVFQKLRDGVKNADGTVVVPGTRLYYGGFDNKVGEDIAMCLNLRKVGIQMYCDTDLISGHIGESIVIDEEYKKKFTQGR